MLRIIPFLCLLVSISTGCKNTQKVSESRDSSITVQTDSQYLDKNPFSDCAPFDNILPKFKYHDLRHFEFDSLDRLIDSNLLVALTKDEFTCLFQDPQRGDRFDRYGNKYYFYSVLTPRGPYYSFVILAHLNELFKGFELVHIDSSYRLLGQVSLLAQGGEAAGWVKSTGGFTTDSTFHAVWHRGWEDTNSDSLGRDSVVIDLLFRADGTIADNRVERKWKIKSNW